MEYMRLARNQKRQAHAGCFCFKDSIIVASNLAKIGVHMNPSKENCRKAQQVIADIRENGYHQGSDPATETDLRFLAQFLARCESKLPYEKSFPKISQENMS